MARCRYCLERFDPTRPMQTCCQKFSCISAAYADQVAKRREKGAIAQAPGLSRKRPPRLRQTRSTGAPTVAEKAWMDLITALGCIVCRLQGRGYVPAAVHHIKQGNRRRGHLFTIPLCDPGHHQNAPASSGQISRHPDKARFEAEYGTEMQLLEETKRALGLKEAA